MQLKIYIPSVDSLGVDFDKEDEGIIIRNEQDILGAGFAVARAVRAWIRRMPLVPSGADLHFPITAEMEGHDEPVTAAAGESKPKRKRKAKE